VFCRRGRPRPPPPPRLRQLPAWLSAELAARRPRKPPPDPNAPPKPPPKGAGQHGPRGLPDPVPLMHTPRAHTAPERLEVEFRRSTPRSYSEREWRRWERGQMLWSGPRCVVGRRRKHVIEEQSRCCADPFGQCPLRGEPFPERNGYLICEVDHIVPWHVHADSSRPNLQALCPICHSMKSHSDGSWVV
jgi:5-methylcytosine-specific restriction endonuclease McrA